MRTLKLNPLRLVLLLGLAASPLLAADSTPAGNPQEERLIAVLKSDASRKEKADACRELARIGTQEAVPALAALLGDEELSHMARYGLETIPDASVDRALRDALGRVHGRPLVGVIGSLGVRKDAAAVKPLAVLLRGSDPDVAQAAARSLGKIATPGAAEAIEAGLAQTAEGNQLAFCEGLLRCAEAFEAKHQPQRAIAIYDHLRSLPATAHQVRTAAWRGAILARGKGGLPLLVEALQASDYALFASANRISQEMPGSPVTLALATELEKPSIDRQTLLAQTLGRRGDNQALPGLFKAARTGDGLVRVAAIRSLARLGSPEAVPVLLELLGDADHEVAHAAWESLAGLPGRDADRAVLSLLGAGQPAQRITGIDLMARRRMVADVPALLKATQDPDAAVRVAALRKVGGLAKEGDLPALLDLLANAKSPEEIEATEQSLGALCGASGGIVGNGVRALAARLPQAQTAQKCALLRVIASVGDTNALQCVRAAVGEGDAEVHATAIRALAGWSTAEAAPDLLEWARSAGTGTDKLLCLRGYLGFAGHADLPAAERLGMCRNAAGLVQSTDEKKLLLAALGGIHSPDSLPLIQPYLEDAATREEAGNAAVGVAAAILQGGQAARLAPQLVAPLEKVAQATANTPLGERAKSLLDKARAKAQGS